MYRSPNRGQIRSKLSSMPVRRTEASNYLTVYKIAVEKERLLQELESLESRKQQIQDRLAILEKEMETKLIQTPQQQHNIVEEITKQSKSYNTLTLKY